MANLMDLLKQAISEGRNYSDLVREVQVAETPQEQAQGLRGKPQGTSMVFPQSQGNFNTKGLNYAINIDKYDNTGNLVQSYRNVPPGIDNLPMGPDTGTVIETPAENQDIAFAKTGGPVDEGPSYNWVPNQEDGDKAYEHMLQLWRDGKLPGKMPAPRKYTTDDDLYFSHRRGFAKTGGPINEPTKFQTAGTQDNTPWIGGPPRHPYYDPTGEYVIFGNQQISKEHVDIAEDGSLIWHDTNALQQLVNSNPNITIDDQGRLSIRQDDEEPIYVNQKPGWSSNPFVQFHQNRGVTIPRTIDETPGKNIDEKFTYLADLYTDMVRNLTFEEGKKNELNQDQGQATTTQDLSNINNRQFLFIDDLKSHWTINTLHSFGLTGGMSEEDMRNHVRDFLFKDYNKFKTEYKGDDPYEINYPYFTNFQTDDVIDPEKTYDEFTDEDFELKNMFDSVIKNKVISGYSVKNWNHYLQSFRGEFFNQNSPVQMQMDVQTWIDDLPEEVREQYIDMIPDFDNTVTGGEKLTYDIEQNNAQNFLKAIAYTFQFNHPALNTTLQGYGNPNTLTHYQSLVPPPNFPPNLNGNLYWHDVVKNNSNLDWMPGLTYSNAQKLGFDNHNYQYSDSEREMNPSLNQYKYRLRTQNMNWTPEFLGEQADTIFPGIGWNSQTGTEGQEGGSRGWENINLNHNIDWGDIIRGEIKQDSSNKIEFGKEDGTGFNPNLPYRDHFLIEYDNKGHYAVEGVKGVCAEGYVQQWDSASNSWRCVEQLVTDIETVDQKVAQEEIITLPEKRIEKVTSDNEFIELPELKEQTFEEPEETKVITQYPKYLKFTDNWGEVLKRLDLWDERIQNKVNRLNTHPDARYNNTTHEDLKDPNQAMNIFNIPNWNFNRFNFLEDVDDGVLYWTPEAGDRWYERYLKRLNKSENKRVKNLTNSGITTYKDDFKGFDTFTMHLNRHKDQTYFAPDEITEEEYIQYLQSHGVNDVMINKILSNTHRTGYFTESELNAIQNQEPWIMKKIAPSGEPTDQEVPKTLQDYRDQYGVENYKTGGFKKGSKRPVRTTRWDKDLKQNVKNVEQIPLTKPSLAATDAEKRNYWLNLYSNKNFVKRLLLPDSDKGREYMDPSTGLKMSHNLHREENIIFPLVVEDAYGILGKGPGQLHYFVDENGQPDIAKAKQYAAATKEYIQTDTEDEAEWFLQNYRTDEYKRATGNRKLLYGGILEDFKSDQKIIQYQTEGAVEEEKKFTHEYNNEFFEFLKEQENNITDRSKEYHSWGYYTTKADKKKGINERKFYAYDSKEGGWQTIGFGHKVQPGEDFSKGLTWEEAEDLLRKDIAKKQQRMENRYGTKSGGAYPWFQKLSKNDYHVLLSHEFQVASSPRYKMNWETLEQDKSGKKTQGGSGTYPSLIKAMVDGDYEKVLKEYKVKGFDTRNKALLEKFIEPQKNTFKYRTDKRIKRNEFDLATNPDKGTWLDFYTLDYLTDMYDKREDEIIKRKKTGGPLDNIDYDKKLQEYLAKGNTFMAEKAAKLKYEQGGALSSMGKIISNVSNWRENLRDNITPYGYGSSAQDIVNRITKTVLFDEKEQKRIELEKEKWRSKEREDLLSMALGLDQKYGSIKESQYRPTITKGDDSNVTYYSSPTVEFHIKNKLSSVISEEERNKIFEDMSGYSPILGNYVLDRGKDDRGEYISYYDKWNLNPTGGLISDEIIDKTLNLNSPEIYGRVYLDEINEDWPKDNKRKTGGPVKYQSIGFDRLQDAQIRQDLNVDQSGNPRKEGTPFGSNWSWSDLGHGILDVLGFIPGPGEVADAANASWYAAEGDFENAAISSSATVPFWGWGATGLKWGKRGRNLSKTPKKSSNIKNTNFTGVPNYGKYSHEKAAHVLDALRSQGKYLDDIKFDASTLTGKNMKFHGEHKGRLLVEVPLPNGTTQMFYKSTTKHNNAWMPYGGTMRKTNSKGEEFDWFAKGTQDDINNFYNSQGYRDIGGQLDRIGVEQGWIKSDLGSMRSGDYVPQSQYNTGGFLSVTDHVPDLTKWRSLHNENDSVNPMVIQALLELDAIQPGIFKDVQISSAHRDQEWNEKIGGQPHSRHMSGMGLDFVGKGWKNLSETLQYSNDPNIIAWKNKWTSNKHQTAGRGVIDEGNHLHLNFKPADNQYTYTGNYNTPIIGFTGNMDTSKKTDSEKEYESILDSYIKSNNRFAAELLSSSSSLDNTKIEPILTPRNNKKPGFRFSTYQSLVDDFSWNDPGYIMALDKMRRDEEELKNKIDDSKSAI